MIKQAVAVYFRMGSESYGFILPRDREAYKAFMNRQNKADATIGKHKASKKAIKIGGI